MAGEYKSSKEVVEQEKPVFWNWYSEVGYESEYNFRGTNLTPGADGAGFFDAEVSKWGVTLGFYGIHQFGEAEAPVFSIAEGGAGAGTAGFSGVGTYSAKTIQTRFNELDVYLQYHKSFGPVDVTVGDIAFFIDRRAQTFLNLPEFGQFGGISGVYGPYTTVGDEEFNRVFIRLATSVIPHIQPWITYYGTVYNNGQDPYRHFAMGPIPGGTISVRYLGTERNDAMGSYVEGRLRGSFSVTHWLDFNPYGVISYSIRDRTEPVANPHNFGEILRGRKLVGFNHVQAGLELPIHLLHFAGFSSSQWAAPDVRINLVPFAAYSYHISDPPVGTDRNEVWGGAKFALSF
jgi:hypothetical protein